MFKKYQHFVVTGRIIEARPYIMGEEISVIRMLKGTYLEEGGMIIRNPDNAQEPLWYMSRENFLANFNEIGEPATGLGGDTEQDTPDNDSLPPNPVRVLS